MEQGASAGRARPWEIKSSSDQKAARSGLGWEVRCAGSR